MSEEDVTITITIPADGYRHLQKFCKKAGFSESWGAYALMENGYHIDIGDFVHKNEIDTKVEDQLTDEKLKAIKEAACVVIKKTLPTLYKAGITILKELRSSK